MTDSTRDATEIWDRRYQDGEHVGSQPVIEGDPIDYTQHKFLYGHAIAKPQTGSLDGYNLDRVANVYLVPKPGRMLALGSGMAFTEEHLLSLGAAESIVAYEMSRVACEAASARVAGKPYGGKLEMRATDVLEDELADSSYDVVFVQAAIHHFERIDEMFALMHRVLKPDGLLIFDEYIGPDHHLYHAEVMAVMNEINDCLAPSYRWDVLSGQTRAQVPIPSLEWMLGHDPTEGVHASRILPLTYQWFDVIDRSDYGGTIMRPFFTGILPNFEWTDPKDQTVARLIVLIEQLLTRSGILPHYHTSVVARRRDTPLAPLHDAEIARIAHAGWQLSQVAPPRPTKIQRAFGRLRRALAELRGRPAHAGTQPGCSST